MNDKEHMARKIPVEIFSFYRKNVLFIPLISIERNQKKIIDLNESDRLNKNETQLNEVIDVLSMVSYQREHFK